MSRDVVARNRIRGSAPQFSAARLQKPRQDARMRKGRRIRSFPRWIFGPTRAHGDDDLSARGGAAILHFFEFLCKLREIA